MLTEAKKETTDQDDITTMATKPTKRKADNEADNKKPPAVLRANASFTSLPMQLQIEIMSYADVPTLGSLWRCSKQSRSLAVKNRFWEPHLKFLLEELFDDGFDTSKNAVTIIPISKRPNWRSSTEFRAWYEECCSVGPIRIEKTSVDGMLADQIKEYLEHPKWREKGDNKRLGWLLKDTRSLRIYYKQAGMLARQTHEMEEEMHEESMEQANRCPNCHHKQWSCVCTGEDSSSTAPGLFDKMPRIRLFRLD
jgi:hypothetical protein